MSQTAITLAFEQWKAQQGATGEAVLLDEFVFASVPGLDPSKPVDRNEKLPPAAQIVYRQAVTRKGVVNDNAVVHSVVLGADVGDFSFNWIGLINKASNTLAMVVHAPAQQKLKTKEGQQGNVLTRSFLMEYNGAQAETGINTPAETWQIDFTARMAGMDERQRLENMDIYGAAAFFGDGWLVGKAGNQFFVTKGAGYVAGLRAELAANQNITVATKPVKVWLDVCWTGLLTSAWGVTSKITVSANLADYEQGGVKHYVFALASIDASGNITDLRPKGSLDNQQSGKDFLRKDKNLSELTNPAEGRKSLGLKGAAVLDVGATANTVAAGDDSRIVNAVQSSRKVNGHALNQDINVTSQDIFNGQSVEIGSGQSLNNFKTPGIYNQPTNNNASSGSNYPEALAGALIVYKGAGVTQIYYVYNSSRVWTRSQYGTEAWTPWAKSYDSINKPSAADVGALPLSGGVMSGEITGDYNGSYAFADQYNTKAPFYQDFYTSGNSEFHPLIKQRSRINTSSWVFSMGALISGAAQSWRLFIRGSAGQDCNHEWDTSGNYRCPQQVLPGNYNNFDARYVSNVRVGAAGTFVINKNTWSEAPVGAFMTGWYFEGDNPGGDSVHYRPIQIYINGGWRTITA